MKTRNSNRYEKGNSRRIPWAFPMCAALVALLVMQGGATAQAAAAPLCSMTSEAARTSCLYETREEFWIVMGNCFNLPTFPETFECMGEGGLELLEAMGECREQYEARQEICENLGEVPYHPEIDPDDFLDVSGIIANPNPYFPLVPGTIWAYEGGDETTTVTVTEETKEILGVTCIVVRDVVEEEGEMIEDTHDWYAQDIHGNVWYFGEISKEYEDGELVALEGSWKSGEEGAKPGIIMKANPHVGDVYRQEFFLGEAEDMGEVLALGESVTVPAGSYTDALKTKDYTPLEPDAVEHKFYAPGIGPVLEVDIESGDRMELVEVTIP